MIVGFVYTIYSYERCKKTDSFKEIKLTFRNRLVEDDLLDPAMFEIIWKLINGLTFIIIWPLWVVQVLLDLTVNKW